MLMSLKWCKMVICVNHNNNNINYILMYTPKMPLIKTNRMQFVLHAENHFKNQSNKIFGEQYTVVQHKQRIHKRFSSRLWNSYLIEIKFTNSFTSKLE